jgi:hypothetical protein
LFSQLDDYLPNVGGTCICQGFAIFFECFNQTKKIVLVAVNGVRRKPAFGRKVLEVSSNMRVASGFILVHGIELSESVSEASLPVSSSSSVQERIFCGCMRLLLH